MGILCCVESMNCCDNIRSNIFEWDLRWSDPHGTVSPDGRRKWVTVVSFMSVLFAVVPIVFAVVVVVVDFVVVVFVVLLAVLSSDFLRLQGGSSQCTSSFVASPPKNPVENMFHFYNFGVIKKYSI